MRHSLPHVQPDFTVTLLHGALVPQVRVRKSAQICCACLNTACELFFAFSMLPLDRSNGLLCKTFFVSLPSKCLFLLLSVIGKPAAMPCVCRDAGTLCLLCMSVWLCREELTTLPLAASGCDCCSLSAWSCVNKCLFPLTSSCAWSA